jgi:hypothetical protein
MDFSVPDLLADTRVFKAKVMHNKFISYFVELMKENIQL